ncbi:hypothetical protein BJY01DRAFT_174664 [Aspergillus pseudoustus]|uniref:Uncharacterized protein n=1 Tax=Aspergillus pseudoustus TaxID=1810923 RepID=A0ABR4K5X6_9EURO
MTSLRSEAVLRRMELSHHSPRKMSLVWSSPLVYSTTWPMLSLRYTCERRQATPSVRPPALFLWCFGGWDAVIDMPGSWPKSSEKIQ